MLLPQRFGRVKKLPRGELLVINPMGILFLFQTDLVKYLQMPVNASNLENPPPFTPKGHPRLCWVIWIILQLQRTAIENASINHINTIHRINRINQYKDNWYNWSDQLTLQTSPTQWHHFCFLFWFALLIKVRIIVVLQYSVILFLRTTLLHILPLFATQSYSGTHSRSETDIPIRNWLLLCISWSAVSSWIPLLT